MYVNSVVYIRGWCCLPTGSLHSTILSGDNSFINAIFYIIVPIKTLTILQFNVLGMLYLEQIFITEALGIDINFNPTVFCSSLRVTGLGIS